MPVIREKLLVPLEILGVTVSMRQRTILWERAVQSFLNRDEYLEKAEILREKGTDRSKFFRGQIDKYRWIDYGSSYLPSELNAAYLYAQLEARDQTFCQKNGDIQLLS